MIVPGALGGGREKDREESLPAPNPKKDKEPSQGSLLPERKKDRVDSKKKMRGGVSTRTKSRFYLLLWNGRAEGILNPLNALRKV